MARTPLAAALRRIFRQGVRAQLAAGNAPPPTRGLHRRDLVRGLALTPLFLACRPGVRKSAQPRVVIVGGGIAGLHCAYRLMQAGIDARLFEASNRTGGRMMTARTGLADDQVCELGAELIDTSHVTMHALAKEFGLTLDDRAATQGTFAAETFAFDGRVLTEAEITEWFTPVAKVMAQDVARMDADAATFAALDTMSITTWLAEHGKLAEDHLLRRLIEVAYTTEFGLPAAEQSAVNLLGFIDYETVHPFRIFGDSDERYHVHGGNDAIVTRLAEQIGDRAVTGHSLTRLRQDAHEVVLEFASSSGPVEIRADYVIVTVPFTRLRDVDLGEAQFSPGKRQVITELGYGTNAKLMMQFTRRVWHEHRAAGSIFSEAPLQTTWDTSIGQAGASGILTNFVGGARGLAIGEGTPEDRAREVVGWIDRIYPGTAAAYRADSAMRMHWPTHPHTRGSYACYRVGQAGWSGREAEAQGRVLFAGEHTSIDFQGFMEGGAESGARAAAELLTAIGRAPVKA